MNDATKFGICVGLVVTSVCMKNYMIKKLIRHMQDRDEARQFHPVTPIK